MIKFTLLLPANQKFVESLLPQAEITERELKKFLGLRSAIPTRRGSACRWPV